MSDRPNSTVSAHVPSYWAATAGPEPAGLAPLPGDRTADVAVLGAGYTGLAAAYRLAGDHGLDTVVLEAHAVGWGASGRNGGFAMMSLGKLTLQQREARWGLATARRIVRLGIDACERVRELILKEGLDCDVQPDGWLNVAHRPDLVPVLRERLRLYRDRLDVRDAEYLDREQLAAEGFTRSPSAYGALRLRPTFGLHPLKYVRGLATAAHRRGAAIHPDSPVVRWDRDGAWHLLATPRGTVRARKVVVGTNGYTPEHLHPFLRGRTLPTTSNIVVTRPLTDAEWHEVGMRTTQVYSDTRALVHYWRRLPDGRMLFGGRAGVINTEAALARRRRWLEGRLDVMFPSLRGIGSEYFWHGAVCMPYDHMPHVHTVDGDPSVAYALAYTGTGVAMATYLGGLAGDLVAGGPVAQDTPVTGTGLPRFPLPFLRRAYLAGAYLVYGLKDRQRFH
jgi:glycine/D-amino acid oxidase-like deaminating enzyme